jgi:Flp pilus assembly protein TadD
MLARLGLCILMPTFSLLSVAVRAMDIPALVQKAKPAVVEIRTYDQRNKLLKTGTGFFISPDGLLLTNYHVISGGNFITAKMPNGAVFFLKGVVTASATYDVAQLQFIATDVSYLTLGSSSDAVEGQRVLVIGNPEDLEGTVSDGIISAFRAGRSMIQITAPVSPGSSGSPVLDESGNVIGIVTQVLKEGQNLNFAISAETIRDAVAESAVELSVTRGPIDDVYNRASEHLKNSDYKAVIADYTEAIRLQPGDSIGYWLRGLAYSHLNQNDNAVNDLNKAIALNPNFPLAYCSRGKAYRDLEQYEKAISDYNQAIRLKPDFAEAYSNRGNSYYALKQYEKAVKDYTEAIRLKPDFAEAYRNRAYAYEVVGKRVEAEQDRKKAKELTGH